ncbi:hypothetical protein [Sporolactobacillus pectinivorans]|uniref:hypothetical protein n=1 Tax=Sporolactobacillus pectinivorans TaxID=1591408 RepID=UPI000C2682DE|nr:hypothetical protein [Sporolactobacillus pectinivorans]
MRRKIIYLLTLSIIGGIALFLLNAGPNFFGARPVITYFPDNGAIVYQKTETHLNFIDTNSQLEWTVQSKINRQAYLIQDFSLLYRNNRLIATINHWKRNEQSLSETRQLEAQPGFYQSLSVHQAELHIDNQIYGKEELSADQLFIWNNSGKLDSFKEPRSAGEKEVFSNAQKKWANSQSGLLERAASQYGFNLAGYQIVPLNQLTASSYNQIFPFSREKAQRITGQLWEGVYKAIIRGLQTPQGTIEPAAGSRLPILLVGSNHLLIVIETEDKQIVLLKQLFD